MSLIMSLETLQLRAGDVITPDDVFDALEDDLKLADMVLWVGISFEQSASTSYFRKVRLRMTQRPHFLSFI